MILTRAEHHVYDIQELFRWIINISVIQLLEEKSCKICNSKLEAERKCKCVMSQQDFYVTLVV